MTKRIGRSVTVFFVSEVAAEANAESSGFVVNKDHPTRCWCWYWPLRYCEHFFELFDAKLVVLFEDEPESWFEVFQISHADGFSD